MSLPGWPEGLRHLPTADSFTTTEPHVPTYATEFEGGFHRKRIRSTLRRALFSMTWRWSAAEYGLFREFYHRGLFDGTMRFTMPVKDAPDGGCIVRTCQFREMYRASISGSKWVVSAEIYVFGGI